MGRAGWDLFTLLLGREGSWPRAPPSASVPHPEHPPQLSRAPDLHLLGPLFSLPLENLGPASPGEPWVLLPLENPGPCFPWRTLAPASPGEHWVLHSLEEPGSCLPLENLGPASPVEPWVLPGKQPDIPLLNGAVQGLGSVAELWRAGGDGASNAGARPRAPAPQPLPVPHAPSHGPAHAHPRPCGGLHGTEAAARAGERTGVGRNLLWCWDSGEASPLQSPPGPGGWVSWAVGGSGAGSRMSGVRAGPLSPRPPPAPPGPQRMPPLPGPPQSSPA